MKKCHHKKVEEYDEELWEYTGMTLTSKCKKCGMYAHRDMQYMLNNKIYPLFVFDDEDGL